MTRIGIFFVQSRIILLRLILVQCRLTQQDARRKLKNLIPTKQVALMVDLNVTTIRAKLYPKHGCFDPTFPRPYKVGGRSLRWCKSDVQKWLDSRLVEVATREAA